MFHLTGRYAVGITELYLKDRSREDCFEGSRRKISVTVWYSARHMPGKAPVNIVDERVINAAIGMGYRCFEKLRGVPSCSVRSAEMAKGKFPLLMHSHGYGLITEASALTCQELASHGYIVASLSHPHESLAAVYENEVIEFCPQIGRLVESCAQIPYPDEYYNDKGLHKEYAAAMEKTFYGGRIEGWVQDMIFVLDSLLSEERTGIRHSIDPDFIGFFGHSFGGAAFFQAAAIDKRVKACVNLDGDMYGTHIRTRPLAVPGLIIAGRVDLICLPIDAKLLPNCFAMGLTRAMHNDLHNLCCYVGDDLFADMGVLDKVPAAHKLLDRERFARSLTAVVRDFFDCARMQMPFDMEKTLHCIRRSSNTARYTEAPGRQRKGSR